MNAFLCMYVGVGQDVGVRQGMVGQGVVCLHVCSGYGCQLNHCTSVMLSTSAMC